MDAGELAGREADGVDERGVRAEQAFGIEHVEFLGGFGVGGKALGDVDAEQVEVAVGDLFAAQGGGVGVHVAREDADGVGDALVVHGVAVEAGVVVEVADEAAEAVGRGCSFAGHVVGAEADDGCCAADEGFDFGVFVDVAEGGGVGGERVGFRLRAAAGRRPSRARRSGWEICGAGGVQRGKTLKLGWLCRSMKPGKMRSLVSSICALGISGFCFRCGGYGLYRCRASPRGLCRSG
jgi:hypothetical protein